MFTCGVGLSQISPILPLFIRDLGIDNAADVARFSGIAFGITFILSAVFSPIWGIVADKYGRKLMLLRASLGLALFQFFTGFVETVAALIIIRALIGITAGYVTACTTLIASQTDKEHAGFAIGTLSTAHIAGSLLGPTLAGVIETFIGIRNVFFATGGLLMLSFLITLIFVKEDFVRPDKVSSKFKDVWQQIPDKRLTISVFIALMTINIAVFFTEPILTVFVEFLSNNSQYIALLAGMIFSANGLATILSSTILGTLSDKVGVHKIILITVFVSSGVYLSQALSPNLWFLLVFNFLLGLSAGGLRAQINILIRKITPDNLTGRMFGLVTTGGYIGMVVGSFLGGQVAGAFGIRASFFCSSALMLMNSIFIYFNIYRKMNTAKLPEHI